MEGVTEGRIVHYIKPDWDTKGPGDFVEGQEYRHLPAIIVRVWDKERGYVNLQVFTDGSNDGYNGNVVWKTSIEYSEEPKPNTWHWPERA